MSTTDHLLTASDLLALTIEPNWADVDPEHHLYLLVALEETHSTRRTDLVRIARWLEAQTVPVVGLGDGGAMLAPAMDAIFATEAELERAVTNLERNPVAASVLVDVLRAQAPLDIPDALALESLAYATLQAGAEFARWLATWRARHPAAPAVTGEVVRLEREGGRLAIALDSSATRNSLSVAMRDQLTSAFRLVAADATITTVDVRGNGPCFSSGGELDEFGSVDDVARAHRIRMLRMPARYLAAHAQRYHFHLHSACIGAGIELPAFAGRITARRDTFFQLPELAMGLIPGAGGCVSIPRRIGRQRTAWMALLNKKVSAERALEWGLVDALED
jgi:hypothetical protein